MLRSFIGTYDGNGLTSLRLEEGPGITGSKRHALRARTFWVVLDLSESQALDRAIRLGQSERALQVLSETARCCGPVCE